MNAVFDVGVPNRDTPLARKTWGYANSNTYGRRYVKGRKPGDTWLLLRTAFRYHMEHKVRLIFLPEIRDGREHRL